ncbi:MAG TPA: SDR family oxidoreductase [Anaerolineae bacterium]|nr:SDR family oxidoreductase [Anaerolineae bacterium]
MNLQDKIALITGGGVRVGRALALGLAGAGAHVVVHYNRSAAAAEETAELARQLGVQALPVQGDLADPDATVALARAALDAFGQVDLLVHAASPFVQGSLLGTDLATWRHVMGVLVDAFFLLARELAPGMMERGEGAMVSIVDRGVLDPWPRYLAHGVGKAALWALTRSLAVDLAPHVRVNAVLPGPVLPPAGFPEELKTAVGVHGTLLRRWGTPDHVVDAVLFLLQNDYVTGELLVVDGGERWAHRQPSAQALRYVEA